MKILALVPARRNSKRLPGKNIRELNGIPMILWTISCASNIAEICSIMVSTDSEDIASVSRGAGALVPWLRPEYLATDDANSVDVALHALEWFESAHGPVDALMLLQPTSPFRSKLTITKGIEIFKLNRESSIVAVSPSNEHPMWSVVLKDGLVRPLFDSQGIGKRMQDLPQTFVINGSFYLVPTSTFKKEKTFLTSSTLPLIIDSPIESLDIDTEWDFSVAEFILKSGYSGFPSSM